MAARLGLIRVVELLLARGADLNVRDGDDLTPLMVACAWDGKKMARVAVRLIEAGADVTCVRASVGMTALDFASLGAEPEVMRKLRKAGARQASP